MTRALLLPLAAMLAAAGLAWWSYRGRFAETAGRIAALCRWLAITALLLLLLDPGLVGRVLPLRPLVLLDNSISMHAAGGRAAEAATLAATLGDVQRFGEAAPGEPGGRSALGEPLTGAVAAGRPVMVLTDGEIADAAELPPDLLAQVAVRLLPRPTAPDQALTEIRAPERLAAGDSLVMEVELQRTAEAPDSARVEVRDGATLLLAGTARFGALRRTRLRLAGPLPAATRGERWLEIRRAGAADHEPGDDLRWWRLTVMPTPGIVVIAAAPDWDARFLYRTLRDVTETAVRGYLQFQPGQWRRMDDLRPVPTAEVQAAARAADLLAVRGDVTPYAASGRARLLWPAAPAAGDWYLAPTTLSPVASAFAGLDPDSLPPASAVQPLPAEATRGWVGAVAKQARRGVEVPVIGGAEGPAGRTVTIGADGLYRWAFRGGASEQAWRTMLAAASSWLLATPESDGTAARPVAAVTQRGRPVRFRWTGAGAPTPLAIELSGAATRSDSLRFDGTGRAELLLPVGRYAYTLGGGGRGTFAVEPYADELVPAAVAVVAREAQVAPRPARRSLRELLWLFALAVAGFGGEWMTRRRLGMR